MPIEFLGKIVRAVDRLPGLSDAEKYRLCQAEYLLHKVKKNKTHDCVLTRRK